MDNVGTKLSYEFYKYPTKNTNTQYI